MRTFSSFLGLVILIAPVASADDLRTLMDQQSKIDRAAPPLLNPYNYTIDVDISGYEGKDVQEPFSAKLLIDPSAAPEARATILSTSREDYPEEFNLYMDEINNPEIDSEAMTEEFWCEGDDNELFDPESAADNEFTILSETDYEAVIKPNLGTAALFVMDADDEKEMSGNDRRMMRKFMKRLDAEITISKPDLKPKQMKVWLTKPVSMAVIAKMEALEMTQTCDVAPNGFAYMSAMSMHTKAKALGVGMEQNMDVKVSGLTLR